MLTKRVVIRLVVVTVLFAFLSAGAYLHRSFLLSTTLRRIVLPIIEQQVDGLKLAVGRVDFEPAAGVQLRNVAVSRATADGASLKLLIPLIQIDYHLPDLWRDRRHFLSAIKLKITNGWFRLWLAAPTDAAAEPAAEFSGLPSLPSFIPAISLENWTIEVNTAEDQWLARDIDWQSKTYQADDPLVATLSVAQLHAPKNPVFTSPADLRADLRYNGRTLEIGRLVFKQTLLSRELSLAVPEPGTMEFSGDLHVLHNVFYLDANVRNQNVEVAFRTDPAPDAAAGRNGLFTTGQARVPLADPLASQGRIKLLLNSTELLGYEIDQLTLDGEVGQQLARIGALRLVSAGNTFRLHDAHLPLNALLENNIEQMLANGSATLNIDLANPAALDAYVPPEALGYYNGAGLHDFQAEVQTGDSRIRVIEARLNSEVGSVSLSGSASLDSVAILGDWRDVSFEAPWHVAVPDLGALASLVPAMTDFAGAVEISGVAKGQLGSPETVVSLSASRLSYQGAELGDMTGEASLNEHEALIKSLVLVNDEDRVTVAGGFDLKEFIFQPSSLTVKLSEINRYCSLFAPNAQEIKGDALLTVHLAGALREPMVHAVLHAEQLAVNDSILSKVEAKADLRARRVDPVEVTLQLNNETDFAVSLGVKLKEDWQLGGITLKRLQLVHPEVLLSLARPVSLLVEDDRLTLGDALEINAGQGSVMLQGVAPLQATGPLALQGRLELPDPLVLDRLLPGVIESGERLEADFDLQGTLNNPRGRFLVRADNIHLNPDKSRMPDQPFTARIEVNAVDQQVVIKEVSFSMPEITLRASGEITPISLPAVLENNFLPDNASINMSGGLRIDSLTWLHDSLPGIAEVGGALQMDYTARGPLLSPQYRADVLVSDGKLRIDGDLPVIRDISLSALITNEQARIHYLRGLAGGAPLELTGDVALLAGDQFGALDIHLTGRDVTFYRGEGIKVRGSSALDITGELSDLRVSGEVRLTDTRISKNIDFISSLTSVFAGGEKPEPRMFSLQDKPLKSARLHVRLTADKPVVIATNVLKTNLRPNLLLTGTGELPYLLGNIHLEDGEFILPAGKLRIGLGRVIFEEAAPDRPRLQLNGKAQMLGYDISAIIEGAYDEPTVTLSSTPFVSNEELLLLLLAGQKPSQQDNGGDSRNQGMGNLAVFLGKGVLARWMGTEDEDEESIVDRLEFDIGRKTTVQGDSTIDAAFFLGDGMLWKNDQIYLTAEKDVWGDINGGLRVVFRFQ